VLYLKRKLMELPGLPAPQQRPQVTNGFQLHMVMAYLLLSVGPELVIG
jgi:hypothetical protein